MNKYIFNNEKSGKLVIDLDTKEFELSESVAFNLNMSSESSLKLRHRNKEDYMMFFQYKNEPLQPALINNQRLFEFIDNSIVNMHRYGIEIDDVTLILLSKIRLECNLDRVPYE